MQLNDAHVFCPPADIATEVAGILDMISHAYDALGISAHHYRLSLRTLGARIRSHRLVPYHAIVGAREAGRDTVSLRLRTGLALDPIPVRDAADHILAEARC
jgi:threonyl-tRNA synthetase